ncbi:MAG: formylglycine-generating enzyme family protein [Bacteroidales bacterium]|nr:formylglycine-generating enzyme family protein [Bacteroidales bacterium]
MKKFVTLTLFLLIICSLAGYSQSEATSPRMSFNITKEVKPPLRVEEPRSIDEDGNHAIDSNLTFTVSGVTFKMVYVQGGTFTMGCTSEQGDDCYSDENPAHSVTLSDYWIGETEVTQALWKAVMGSTVSQQRDKVNSSWSLRGEGSSYPMYYVSWEEAVQFCSKLNSMVSSQLPSGWKFSLPTEAQWEYAARGGNKKSGYKYAGGNSIGEVAWYDGNGGSGTHPVKGKSPNALGLYDMTGNVWEWCSDWYGSYSSGAQTNPEGPSSGSLRVLRGGSWSGSARHCRVPRRFNINPAYRFSDFGFRLSIVH